MSSTTVAERAFLDTNVLVYVFDHDAGRKRTVAQNLLDEAAASGRCVLSTQVLQEFYVVVTRKLTRPLSHADARTAVEALAQFPVVQLDANSVIGAIERVDRLQLSLWDSLIVQAALESGCTRLLTEDLQHGQSLDGVRVENPFRLDA